MYIDLLRRVLEQAVDSYAAECGRSVSEVLAEIRTHIDATAGEHQKDEPDIKYEDALCRLGYLYRHATANATLFELVVTESGELRSILRKAGNQRLNMCAVGGGPGTELLGLAKFLLQRGMHIPIRITFTILDNIPQWAETWQQLADAVEEELQRAATTGGIASCPVIVPAFLHFDVLDPESYTSYAYQFKAFQVIVFNYLFSENKTRLTEAKAALTRLYAMAPTGCVFVVIDRLENNRAFSNEVIDLCKEAFQKEEIRVHHFNGTLDRDEQTEDMGKLFSQTLGCPRVKFFTPGSRSPTVFWFTAVKE